MIRKRDGAGRRNHSDWLGDWDDEDTPQIRDRIYQHVSVGLGLASCDRTAIASHNPNRGDVDAKHKRANPPDAAGVRDRR